jgi:hypothetical protein
MLIPGQSQLVGGGKAGKMYLINTTNMGQMQANDAGAAQTLFFSRGATSQTCVTNHGETVTGDRGTTSFYGTAAWFNGSLFVGNDPGPVKQFILSSGHLTAGDSTAEKISPFSYGTTPFISSNGTSDGIVWVLDHGHPIQDPVASPAPAVLRPMTQPTLRTCSTPVRRTRQTLPASASSSPNPSQLTEKCSSRERMIP